METKEYDIMSAAERIAIIHEARQSLISVIAFNPHTKKPPLSEAYIGLEKAFQGVIMVEAKALVSTSQ